MGSVPTKTLPSGDDIPMVGFGTWNLSGETVKSSVRTALEAGYTHIDTAEGYKNEAEIGEVLTEYDRSPAEVILRWALARDTVVLPKSTSSSHIETNLAAWDWDLPEEDLSAIDDLNRDEPVYDQAAYNWGRDVYGISE